MDLLDKYARNLKGHHFANCSLLAAVKNYHGYSPVCGELSATDFGGLMKPCRYMLYCTKELLKKEMKTSCAKYAPHGIMPS